MIYMHRAAEVDGKKVEEDKKIEGELMKEIEKFRKLKNEIDDYKFKLPTLEISIAASQELIKEKMKKTGLIKITTDGIEIYYNFNSGYFSVNTF